MCYSGTALLLLFSACYTLVASRDVWGNKSGCLFRIRFYAKLGPPFRMEADPKTLSENGRLKIHRFRV